MDSAQPVHRRVRPYRSTPVHRGVGRARGRRPAIDIERKGAPTDSRDTSRIVRLVEHPANGLEVKRSTPEISPTPQRSGDGQRKATSPMAHCQTPPGADSDSATCPIDRRPGTSTPPLKQGLAAGGRGFDGRERGGPAAGRKSRLFKMSREKGERARNNGKSGRGLPRRAFWVPLGMWRRLSGVVGVRTVVKRSQRDGAATHKRSQIARKNGLSEVTGAWWCPWSSKPAWGPRGSWVGSIPIHLR